MPRTARIAPGGMVFHVLNRGVARMQLFEKAGDYEAFERVLAETLLETPMRICTYCLLPNHWHLLVWPEHDGDLGRFMHRLTITHVRRWQEHRHYVGLSLAWPPKDRTRWEPGSRLIIGRNVSCLTTIGPVPVPSPSSPYSFFSVR